MHQLKETKARKRNSPSVENCQFHDQLDRVIDQVHRKIHLLLMYYMVLPLRKTKLFFLQQKFVLFLIKLFTSASGEPKAGILCLTVLVYSSWNFFRLSNSYWHEMQINI